MSSNEYYTIELNGSSATIASRGAVVTSWKVPSEGSTHEVLDGYQNDEELFEVAGSRNSVLAPWSNRIEDSRYSWDGVDYDLGPDKNGVRDGLHGLMERRDFEVVYKDEDSIVLETIIDASELGTSADEGALAYPVPLKVTVKYELGQSLHKWSLNLRLNAQNLGDKPAPIGLGWHPYIRYDGDRDSANITVRARTRIAVDQNLIPLKGEEAFEATESFDPMTGVATISNLHDLDSAFTDLTVGTGDEAYVSATLHHASGATTELKAANALPLKRGIGIFHVFTGEPLDQRPGEAVALEYCQFMADAFNRAECQEDLPVAPRSSRVMRASLIHTPPQQ